MKVILSPAKSINENVDCSHLTCTQHLFQDESQRLAGKLAKLSARQIKKLMGVSQDIADLNYNRFQEWSLPFTPENSKPAGIIFTGAAYQSLDFASLSKKEMEVGQEKLRILSGLYGILKPLDLIQPYRLEMGISFKNNRGKNLYEFWKEDLTSNLNKTLKDKKALIQAISCQVVL